MSEKEKEKIKKNRSKIIISSSDELTDVLRKISSVEDTNVLLTFADESDLLVSPINLKVLQEVCDEFKKNIILQIIQNSSGVRNAKIAGVLITESASEVEDDLWLLAEKRRRQRGIEKNGALRSQRNVSDVKKNNEDEEIKEETKPLPQDSEYQDRVQQVIEKSRDLKRENKGLVRDEDFTFAIGQDIDDDVPKKNSFLIGKNFNNIDNLKNIKDNFKGNKIKKVDGKEGTRRDIKKEKKPIGDKEKLALKKKLILVSGIGFGSVLLTLLILYYTLPFVQVQLYVETKAVEVEKVFESDNDIDEIDIEKGLVPIKKEVLTVSRSDHANTTGTGIRGEKAEGIILFKYWSGYESVIPAGTIISKDDLQFEITKDVEIPDAPATVQDVPVRALEPGADFNLSSGNVFSVQNFGEELTAENKSSFSGGLSEKYSKLSQEDFDQLKDILEKEAFKEGLKQLKEKHPEWVLIEESVKQVLDGDGTTDIPIDGEGQLFNMSLSTKTTGLFFNEKDILDNQQDFLKKAAKDQDLFKSDENIKLELDENIDSDLKVLNVTVDSFSLDFKVKGYVRVNVDTKFIADSLTGRGWDEGKKILKDFEFSNKDPKVVFKPSYFPDFLRHFPTNSKNIEVKIELIEVD